MVNAIYLVDRQSKVRKENNFSVSMLTAPCVFLFDYLGSGVIFFAWYNIQKKPRWSLIICVLTCNIFHLHCLSCPVTCHFSLMAWSPFPPTVRLTVVCNRIRLYKYQQHKDYFKDGGNSSRALFHQSQSSWSSPVTKLTVMKGPHLHFWK